MVERDWRGRELKKGVVEDERVVNWGAGNALIVGKNPKMGAEKGNL